MMLLRSYCTIGRAGSNLQVDDEEQLVLDLKKARRQLRREGLLHLLVIFPMERGSPGLQIECLVGECDPPPRR